MLDGVLITPDRVDRRTRELVEVRNDADAQYRAIEKLRLYRDTLAGWTSDESQVAVRVPVAQAGTGEVTA